MRISVLLQREPFGEILERTLARFWSVQYGEIFEVCWEPRSLRNRLNSSNKRQRWYANYFINGIFTGEVDEQALEPLRREFGRSPIPWRDPLQRIYVGAASRLPFAAWLAQAHVHVTPSVPDTRQKLIVPGSAKMRILDHVDGTVDVILKEGFDKQVISNELKARSLASEYGIPTPQIFESDVERGWLREVYVLGTPINRLGDRSLAEKTAESLLVRLREMSNATEELIPIESYIKDLVQRIYDAIDDFSHRLGEREGHLRELVERLSTWSSQLARGCGMKMIPIAQTHGDFQPANILQNGERLWLIDWERAGKRIAPYDALVFALRSRSPRGLSGRLMRFVQGENYSNEGFFISTDRSINWRDKQCRVLIAGLFFLEELLFHCEENAVPVLTSLSSGLNEMMANANEFIISVQDFA